MKDFKDRLQNIIDTNFGSKEKGYSLNKIKPYSNFDQLKKAKNELKNNVDITNIYSAYSAKIKEKEKSTSLNKLQNIRSMILNEKQDPFRDLKTSVKVSFDRYDRFQAIDINNSCSPKNTFFNKNINKNELRNSILSIEGNINTIDTKNNNNKPDFSKVRCSFERLATDFIKINNQETNFSPNYPNFKINGINIDSNSNFKNFSSIGNNSLNNSTNFSNNNSGKTVSYNDLLLQQQENRMNKIKKNNIINIIDDKPIFESNNISDRYNLTKNSVKNPNGFIETNKKFNSILNENPEIKERLNFANGNTKNYNPADFSLNIDNYGMYPGNKSNNCMNSSVGKDIFNFLNKNKTNVTSPSKDNLSNRNSLKNLHAIKNQLENLFDKNQKNDKGYNNAMDNLCAFLNYKQNKSNGATQQNNRSVKLMEEIKHMRKSFSKNRTKSANKPKIIPNSPKNGNNSGYINTLYSFSPSTNKSCTNNNHKNNLYGNSKILNFSIKALNTSVNTSNVLGLHKQNSNFYHNEKNLNNNYSRLFTSTDNPNYNLNTLNDLNYTTTNNNINKNQFNLNNTYFTTDKKSGGNSRMHTICHDESVEEFSKDLENPNRKDSLLTKYLKKKKINL